MAIEVKRKEKLKSYSLSQCLSFPSSKMQVKLLICYTGGTTCNINAVKLLFKRWPDCCVSINSGFCIALTCT